MELAEIVAGEIKLLLRLPSRLHAALVRLRLRDTRSLNGEMIYLLRRAVIDAGEDPDADLPADE